MNGKLSVYGCSSIAMAKNAIACEGDGAKLNLPETSKQTKPNPQKRLTVPLPPLWHLTVQSVVVTSTLFRFTMTVAYFLSE